MLLLAMHSVINRYQLKARAQLAMSQCVSNPAAVVIKNVVIYGTQGRERLKCKYCQQKKIQL